MPDWSTVLAVIMMCVIGVLLGATIATWIGAALSKRRRR